MESRSGVNNNKGTNQGPPPLRLMLNSVLFQSSQHKKAVNISFSHYYDARIRYHLASQWHPRCSRLLLFLLLFCWLSLSDVGTQPALHFGGGNFHEILIDDVIVLIQSWYNFFANGHI